MKKFEKKNLDKKQVEKEAGIAKAVKTAGKIVGGIVVVAGVAIKALPKLIKRS